MAKFRNAGSLKSAKGFKTPALISLVLILALQFPLHCVSATPLPIRFEHLMTDSQNTVSEISTIIQDHQGYIWLGGSSGLARYDAYEFKIYNHETENPSSLSGNFVFSLYEDSDNDLWVLTRLGLNLYDRDTDSFTRFVHNPENPSSIGPNSATSMIQDDEGFLWVGTHNGLYRFNKENQTFTHYMANPQDTNSLSQAYVNALLRDKKGDIWISTVGGLNRLDPKTETFKRYIHDPNNPNSISHNNVGAMVEDSAGYLWVGSRNGLNRLDPERKRIDKYFHDANDPSSISENRITTLFLDKKSQVWIGTNESGVNIYNPENKNFHKITQDETAVDSLSSNKIRGIFEDTNSGIWIATFPSGLHYSNPQKSIYRVIRNKFYDRNSLTNDSILTIEEDKANDLWIGTEKGLSLYNRKNETFKNYQHNPRDPESLPANAVLAIQTDDSNNAWIGMWSGGLSYIEKNTGKLTSYTYDSQKPYDNTSITDISVWSLEFDRQGHLWIGTQAGALSKLNTRTREFTHYFSDNENPNTPSGPFTTSLLMDHEGVMWIGTLSGLNRYNSDDDSFSQFQYAKEGQFALGKNSIHAIFEDSKNRLWVGTESGLGEFHRNSETFTFLSSSDGLRNDFISEIIEDAQETLWIGTFDGLINFDPEKNIFTAFSTLDGLAGNTTNRSSGIFSRDGNIYFGTTTGISVFDPSKIISNRQKPPIRITDFKVFNKSLQGVSHILSQTTYESEEPIKLDYSQNMFSVQFTALDYTQPEKNNYEYRLIGFDENWRSAGNTRTASYTNLGSGRYQFRVRGSNSDKIWSDNEASINIEVLPSPWRSKKAYLFYFLLFLFLIYIGFRYQLNKLKFQQEKIKHFRYIDKLKNQILANTSHELRTPLNGIIGLAESLMNKDSIIKDEDSAHALNIIILSGRRLGNLVNDILDFSKVQENTLDVHLVPVKIAKAVRDVLEITKPLSEDKFLRVENCLKDDSLCVYADEERLQQVLLNILGNAIKFTHSGSVTIECETDGEFANISITDTGRGIPEDHLENIFNAFEQIQDSTTRDQGGTGLGLAITRKLVTLQNGEINVESTVGKGSRFNIKLEIANPEDLAIAKELSHQEQAEINKSDSLIRAISAFSNLYPSMSEPNRLISEGKDSASTPSREVLIVDDDPINRMVLSAIISKKNYNITEANSGIETLSLFDEGRQFDLILLDVMMPSLSGHDVCRKIRETIPENNLPIVFLSANHGPNEPIEALVCGGNDFLVKPTTESELLNCVEFLMMASQDNKLLHQGLLPENESTFLSKFEAAEGIAKKLNTITPPYIDIYIWIRDTNASAFRPVYVDHSIAVDKNALTLEFQDSELEKITKNLPKQNSKIVDKRLLTPLNKLKSLTRQYIEIAALSIGKNDIGDGFFLICSKQKQNDDLTEIMAAVDATAKHIEFAIDKHRRIHFLRNQNLTKIMKKG